MTGTRTKKRWPAEYKKALKLYAEGRRRLGLKSAGVAGRLAAAGGAKASALTIVHLAYTPSDNRGKSGAADLTVVLVTAIRSLEKATEHSRQTEARMTALNKALGKQNQNLSAINRSLHQHIAERKRTEKALRESEEHYRQLFREARQMQESLRQLSSQMLHVQEEERKRISRELHDEVSQAMTAINMNLAVIRQSPALTDPALKQKIQDAQNLLEGTMEIIHRFARELRPALLDDLGLGAALRSYLKAFGLRTGLQVRFQLCPETERLDNEQKIVLYRVAQESLTNVAKHAQASEVELTIRPRKHTLTMEVRDDGRSFSPSTNAGAPKRLGLLGIQERVRLVNGRFAIHSAPNKGTRVVVEIPFAPSA